ncbi:MAG: DUF3445 domain-containing protein, partial [Verrucomicrobiales bacterium]|nr:DUF3445 domain-containing protein [Verrucomicrobiales bacterium]
QEEAHRHAPLQPQALEALRETAECFHPRGDPNTDLPSPSKARDLLTALGSATGADLVWLQGTADAPPPRVVAAAVCAPSAWDPAEKLGRSLAEIHAVVPGLNPTLGPALDTFLARLRPGPAWLRANWGLSASPELNQHPSLQLPRLRADVTPDQVWVRIEHQALVALPRTGAILFGIRVEILSLRTLLRQPALHLGLARALHSMPADMARYKGLAEARDALMEILQPPPDTLVG